MAVTYLQGYLCEEDLDDTYVLDIVECGSATHMALIACSTLGLILFLSFIVVERLLFNSRNFESEVPWGSLERQFDFLKLILKLIQSIAFAFDKKGTRSGYINLICFSISLIIVYNRNTRAIVIDESAFLATNIYDSMLLWLFFFVGV